MKKNGLRGFRPGQTQTGLYSLDNPKSLDEFEFQSDQPQTAE